jgi:hypothetical protein
MRFALIFSFILIGIGEVSAAHQPSGRLDVLVDGAAVPKYHWKGIAYLEAIRGKEYEIRITNPIGARVAVALSVDGFNTIDARHTEAASARKWVLGPYESVVISGWQTNASQARRFFFSTEERSYGAWLGQKDDLGIISAAFFRERIVARPVYESPRGPALSGTSPGVEKGRPSGDASSDPRPQTRDEGESRAEAPVSASDYAATGIGDRISHEVQWIRIDLEDRPFATVDLRYEFRPALVRLGVLSSLTAPDPLLRREKASGFRDRNYCPEPY